LFDRGIYCRFSVQGFLIIALDRSDVVLAGDLAIRRAIKKVYGLEQFGGSVHNIEVT
jgi:3-methyladenine DNA glycosylase/8-oxoguanine DNA glycosylase